MSEPCVSNLPPFPLQAYHKERRRFTGETGPPAANPAACPDSRRRYPKDSRIPPACCSAVKSQSVLELVRGLMVVLARCMPRTSSPQSPAGFPANSVACSMENAGIPRMRKREMVRPEIMARLRCRIRRDLQIDAVRDLLRQRVNGGPLRARDHHIFGAAQRIDRVEVQCDRRLRRAESADAPRSIPIRAARLPPPSPPETAPTAAASAAATPRPAPVPPESRSPSHCRSRRCRCASPFTGAPTPRWSQCAL